ncbi:14966_t:CDS:1, partial [Gigaspora margarita]
YNQVLPSDGQRNVRIKSGSLSSNSKQISISSNIKFCKNAIPQ